MRIGYLVPEFPSQTHAFFWREVRAIRELGHEVKLLSTTRPVRDLSLHEFTTDAAGQTEYLASPPVTAVSNLLRQVPRGGFARAMAYVARCDSDGMRDRARLTALATCGIGLAGIARREKLDHIHIHSCADAAHLGAVAHRAGGIPFSLTLHGDLPVYGINHENKMAEARFVAAVTRPLQSQVRQLMSWPAERVPVVQMGVDTRRFAPRTEAIDEPCRRPLRILTVARLNPTKGHSYALEAIRRVLDSGTELRWVVAGEGESRAEIEAGIDRLDLAAHVHLVGTASEGQVIEMMNDADVFLLPSFGLGEAAPVSVMEAMSCGLAVISTTIGGTPVMIADGSTGLLIPQMDVGALTRALVELADDPQRRHDLGSAARTHALVAFDYRTNASRLVSQMGA